MTLLSLETKEPTMPTTTGQLGLTEIAKKAADLLVQKHPNVVFTSGRRTIKQQASAMAGNIKLNRKWIEETYAASPQRTKLQKWVDQHPQATTKAAIAAGLESVFETFTDKQKNQFSRHITGQAFDVQPVAGEAGKKIKKTIKALPNLRKFLTKEGGLVRWHADFE